jgi:hypothetical protein
MWRETGLLGRDRLLGAGLARARAGVPVYIVGRRGVGRSAILAWLAAHISGGRVALISGGRPVSDVLRAVLGAWGVHAVRRGDREVSLERATVAELEAAMSAQPSGGVICVDDLHLAAPALLRRLRVWRERHMLHYSAVPPLREEAAPLVWGAYEVQVPPLDRRSAERMAQAVCARVASRHAPSEVARLSRGVPARIVALARGALETRTQRAAGEEVDLSPALLLAVVGVVVLRVVGVVDHVPDLYALGAIGVAVALLLRVLIWRGGAR